jgi:diacylglycerol kinase family enzyme
VLQALELHFPAARIDYTVHEPRKGDAFGEIVRARLGEGFDLVVAAGGDGTVSAVVDGLAGSAVPLGIIPTGTANLVARELNIPLVPREAVELIVRAPRSRTIDAMRIGTRVYVLVAGGTSAGSGSSPISARPFSRCSNSGPGTSKWPSTESPRNIMRSRSRS